MSERDYKTISFIVPTIGRDSLKKTVASVETWPGDELLVIQHNPPSGNWGNAERQEGTDKAQCDYLAFIDDDDVYIPGARKIMDKAIKESPEETPILFKMQYPSGRTLWNKKFVKNGNVGAPMILVPNIKKRLAEWDQMHSWADFYFINRWKWFHEEINWRDEVVVLLGHNDEKWEKNLSHGELAEVQRKRWNL
jgi:glycosyltransferase involved in cell wall biosynthesis